MSLFLVHMHYQSGARATIAFAAPKLTAHICVGTMLGLALD
jgi:hypothetical protein